MCFVGTLFITTEVQLKYEEHEFCIDLHVFGVGQNETHAIIEFGGPLPSTVQVYRSFFIIAGVG